MWLQHEPVDEQADKHDQDADPGILPPKDWRPLLPQSKSYRAKQVEHGRERNSKPTIEGGGAWIVGELIHCVTGDGREFSAPDTALHFDALFVPVREDFKKPALAASQARRGEHRGALIEF
ncbi:hypothetical protein MVI01_46270 [Myxococcus virescens]|uniref:Uncharacterized protein n=1 Tax=Myxococcus virescens TaxID=83456 RepID=A0A511HGZ2_9BACT|nr:hypothetical protein MVI01_46270 [Myxococcus virescens]